MRLIDSRHDDIILDHQVEQFLSNIKKPDQIVICCYTKIDKLKKTHLQKLKQKNQNATFVSNTKNIGIDILNDKITKFLFVDSSQ